MSHVDSYQGKEFSCQFLWVENCFRFFVFTLFFFISGCAFFPCYLQHFGAGIFHFVCWNLPFCLLFVAYWSWNLPFCLLFASFWSWNLAFGMLSASRCWLLVVVFSLWVGVPGGTHQQLLMAWFLFGCRQCLWFPYACGFGCGEHQQSHEVNRPSIKALQSQGQRKLAKQSRPEKTKKQKKEFRVVCAIFSAFCNVNLRRGDRTSHFAWHLRHLEDRPFQLHGIADFCR